MATAYGSYNKNMRAVLVYSTSDSTATSIKVTCTCKLQGVIEGDDIYQFSNMSGTLTASGAATGTQNYTASTSTILDYSGTITLGTKTYTITKSHSTKTLSLSWKVTASRDVASEDSTSVTSTASATVSIPAQTSYTVSYNANGGSGAPSSQTKWYGESLTLSSTKPTRTGYTFKNWNTKSDGSGTTYSAGTSYTGNAALTLYAQWQINTYTVKYAANGGSSTPDNQTKIYGTALTLRAAISKTAAVTNYTVTYKYNGNGSSDSTASTKKTISYTFNKWKSTDGTYYSASGSYTANAATTMTAQWTSTTAYTSTTLPSPTWTGHTFLGWYTASSGGTKVGAGGASYTPTASITLYAHWELTTYAIKYYVNGSGGSGAPSTQTKTYGVNLMLSSTRPVRTGYTFVKWNTKSDGSGTNYNPEQTYTSNAALNLYAVWQVIKYTITYNANGGSGAPSSQTKNHGTNLTLSSTKPTRTYYNFLGWSTSAKATSATYSAGGTYSTNASATLYAVWQQIYYAPKINKLIVRRCTSDGTLDDEGTYVSLSCSWTAGTYNGSTAAVQTVTFKIGSSTTVNGTISGTTATARTGTFSVNSRYLVVATVTDAHGNATKSTYLSPAFYTMDFYHGGKGIGIGTAVSQEGLFVNMPLYSYSTGSFTGNFNAAAGTFTNTVTGSKFAVNGVSKGYFLVDGNGNEYPALYGNSSNLWIGAYQTNGYAHHIGGTVISSGYNTATSKGNETIYISVPNAANDDAVNYGVWHTGNALIDGFNLIDRTYTSTTNPYTYTKTLTTMCTYLLIVGRVNTSAATTNGLYIITAHSNSSSITTIAASQYLSSISVSSLTLTAKTNTPYVNMFLIKLNT